MSERIKCPECGQENFPTDVRCSACNAELKPKEEGAEPTAPPPERPAELVQEAPLPGDQASLNQEIVNWGRVIFSPISFFREQAERKGIIAVLVFVAIFGLIMAVFQEIKNWSSQRPHLLALAPGLSALNIGDAVITTTSLWLGRFVVTSAIYHFLARIFRGSGNFYNTARVVGYACAPWILFNIIISVWLTWHIWNIRSAGSLAFDPYLISLGIMHVSLVWFGLLVMLGMRDSHRLSLVMAALVAFIPIALCILWSGCFLDQLQRGFGSGRPLPRPPFWP